MMSKKISTDDYDIIAAFGDRLSDKADLQTFISLYHQDSVIAELRQIHSCKVIIISDWKLFKKGSKNADAMATKLPRIALTIRTADCYPILFWDPVNSVIAAAHSGREGTRLNITSQTIKAMLSLGANKDNIIVTIGPGISPEHYPVDKVTWQKFCTSTNISQNFPFLDLRKVINTQLLNSGIKIDNISNISLCTFSNHYYNSYRRNKTSRRQFSTIMLS